MTPEEKELLLKDLCARLPYNVCVKTKQDEQISFTWNELKNFTHNDEICKPYLRPMDSMTEEERGELRKFCEIQSQILEDIGVTGKVNSIAVIDFFNAHHFDYRGLIEKCLALEAPEGMY